MRRVRNLDGSFRYPSLSELARSDWRGDPVAVPEEIPNLAGDLIPRECATPEEIDLATEGWRPTPGPTAPVEESSARSTRDRRRREQRAAGGLPERELRPTSSLVNPDHYPEGDL